MKAFYMAPDNLRTPRTNEPIVEGETVYTVDRPELCRGGLHASPTPNQTLNYRDYGRMTVVEVEGDVQVDPKEPTKICGRSRKTLKIFSKEETNDALKAKEDAFNAAFGYVEGTAL